MTESNPLKQFFRRPAVYLKLPSGGVGYPEGAINLPENGEIPIYPMTAIDEITSRTPDSLFNGVAVVELIKSCVPDIKDPWSVSNVDLDPLLVAIRSATHGNMMEIETSCPSCDEVSKFDVNLSAVLSSFKPADYSVPLELGDLRIKFKPMSYKIINEFSITQFGLQKSMADIMNIEDETKRDNASGDILKNILSITIDVISSTIEHIKAPGVVVFEQDYIKEFLSNCDKQTFDKIKDYSTELKKATQTKPLDIKCPECSHEFQQDFNINVSDFFA